MRELLARSLPQFLRSAILPQVKGRVIESLLDRMLEHEYFSRPAPKSTGRYLFNHCLAFEASSISRHPGACRRQLRHAIILAFIGCLCTRVAFCNATLSHPLSLLTDPGPRSLCVGVECATPLSCSSSRICAVAPSCPEPPLLSAKLAC